MEGDKPALLQQIKLDVPPLRPKDPDWDGCIHVVRRTGRLVAARLGFAISTPLCLWQARHYLPEIAVLPLPSGKLGRRGFFLLHREGEWDEFARELTALTQRVLDHNIRPALAKALPRLPDDAIRRPSP